MKLLVFILLCLTSFISYSQFTDSDIVGHWKVIDIENKGYLTRCFSPLSDEEYEKQLEYEYLNASLEFLESKKIIFIDKNSKPHLEKDCEHFMKVQNFKWKLIYDYKLRIVNTEQVSVIKNKIKEKRMQLIFIDIIFTLEKSPNHLQLSKPKQ